MHRFVRFLDRLMNSLRPEGVVTKHVRIDYRSGTSLRTIATEVPAGVGGGPIRIALRPMLFISGVQFDEVEGIDRPVSRHLPLEDVISIDIEQTDIEEPGHQCSLRWARNPRGLLTLFTEE